MSGGVVEMAGLLVVLSPTKFAEGKLGRRSKSQLFSGRHSFQHFQQQQQQQHTDDEDPNKSRMSSRRESLAALLQIALLCAPPIGDAHAVQSTHLKEELETENGCESSGAKLLIFNSCSLAYLGALNSSGSGLGFFGCLIFGLLYLKEKQAHASNVSTLKDVQLHVQRAESELSVNMKSYIEYKLEESQLDSGIDRDNSAQESVKSRQLCTIKSNNAEKRQKLAASKQALEALKQQAVSLVASVDEQTRYCSSHAQRKDQQYSRRQGLELEVKGLYVDLEFKVDALKELKVAAHKPEQASNKLIEQIVAAESSLCLMSEKLVILQAKCESLNNSLSTTKNTFEVSSNKLTFVTDRNAILEVKLNELLRCLQHEQTSFKELLSDINEQLVLTKNTVDVCLEKLLGQRHVCDMELRTASLLTVERGALNQALGEKKDILENIRKALCSDLERRKILEMDWCIVCQQLQQEKEQNSTLLLARKDNVVLVELTEISAQLKGQLTVEKELVDRFKKDKGEYHEALRLSRQNILELEDNMLSTLSDQRHLQDDLTRLNEVQNAHRQALKKQKRAVAYAKKQLTHTSKILAVENQALEVLKKELQSARKLIEDCKLQIASHSNQVEKPIDINAQVADSLLAPRAVLPDKQANRGNSNKNAY